jgi:hypothetical protein
MVPITDTRSEPAQPRREEKKANMGEIVCTHSASLGRVTAELIEAGSSGC